MPPPMKEVAIELSQTIYHHGAVPLAVEDGPTLWESQMSSDLNPGRLEFRSQETDVTDQLIQMFMTDIDNFCTETLTPGSTNPPSPSLTSSASPSNTSDTLSLSPTPHMLTPSPTPTLTPSPTPHTPTPSPTSLTLTPSLTGSLESPLFSPPMPTCTSSSPVSDASQSPTNPTDPALVSFFDLDGLLNDSALFESPLPPNSDFLSPYSDHTTTQNLLQELLPLLPLPSLPPTPSHESTEESTDELPVQGVPSDWFLLSPLDDASASHKHLHASSQSVTEDAPAGPCRKRKVAKTDPTDSPGSAKKSKQTAKEDKYITRRQKNNVASQVSRAKRRARHGDMFKRVRELEKTNAELKAQIAAMEAEAEELKKSLVVKLSTSPPTSAIST